MEIIFFYTQHVIDLQGSLPQDVLSDSEGYPLGPTFTLRVGLELKRSLRSLPSPSPTDHNYSRKVF